MVNVKSPKEAQSPKACRASFSESGDSPPETTRRSRPLTPLAADLALRVPQAMTKGVTKFGRRLRSLYKSGF